MLGGGLIAASQVRAGVGFLAWLAPVPWLRYLRLTAGWPSRLAFAGALFGAWTLATAKIASEPMFLALAPIFALPITISQIGAYLAWDLVRKRLSPVIASGVFAIAAAVGEWAIFSLTPFGSWGATAYTQLDNLPLLQTASVFGIAGIGALVSFVAASVESIPFVSERPWRVVATAGALVVSAHALGTARLALADVAEPETIAVAAITTDSDVRGLPLPSRAATHTWDRVLLDRTREAAQGGAVLAVWPEAATLIWPDEETTWLDQVQTVARASKIDIVAAYVMPTEATPFAYRNEFRFVSHDGALGPVYAKHHPVPGEPAIKGAGPAPLVERNWGWFSGAICYDYDFPAMGRGRAGVDLVAVPASDWRGIDPVHAQMAAVRGIESGHSVLRATRWGLSLATDPYGRIRAWHSAFERSGSGIMYAEVPRKHIRTLYALWGDFPLAVVSALVAALVATKLLRKRAHFNEPLPTASRT
jgi:apolipoprotein N-acyltransferase